MNQQARTTKAVVEGEHNDLMNQKGYESPSQYHKAKEL